MPAVVTMTARTAGIIATAADLRQPQSLPGARASELELRLTRTAQRPGRQALRQFARAMQVMVAIWIATAMG